MKPFIETRWKMFFSTKKKKKGYISIIWEKKNNGEIIE